MTPKASPVAVEVTPEASPVAAEVTPEVSPVATQVTPEVSARETDTNDVQKPTEIEPKVTTEASSGSVNSTPEVPQVNPVIIQPVYDDLVDIMVKNVENTLKGDRNHSDAEEVVVTGQTGPKGRKITPVK